MADYEYDPLTGDPMPKSALPVLAHETANAAISTAQLAALDSMPKYELIALIKRVAGAMWGYALLSSEQKREALRLKIYSIAMQSSQDAVTLKAANDWLDREEGKPVQRVVQDTTLSFDLKANGALLTRMAERLGSKQQIVIDAMIDQ